MKLVCFYVCECMGFYVCRCGNLRVCVRVCWHVDRQMYVFVCSCLSTYLSLVRLPVCLSSFTSPLFVCWLFIPLYSHNYVHVSYIRYFIFLCLQYKMMKYIRRIRRYCYNFIFLKLFLYYFSFFQSFNNIIIRVIMMEP